MTEERLKKEIAIQIGFLDATVQELCLLRNDLSCANRRYGRSQPQAASYRTSTAESKTY